MADQSLSFSTVFWQVLGVFALDVMLEKLKNISRNLRTTKGHTALDRLIFELYFIGSWFICSGLQNSLIVNTGLSIGITPMTSCDEQSMTSCDKHFRNHCIAQKFGKYRMKSLLVTGRYQIL